MIAWKDDYDYCSCGTYNMHYSGTTTTMGKPCPIHSTTIWVSSYISKPTSGKEQLIPKWWWYFKTFSDVQSLYIIPITKARKYAVYLIRRLLFPKSGYLPKRIRRIKKQQ